VTGRVLRAVCRGYQNRQLRFYRYWAWLWFAVAMQLFVILIIVELR